VNTVARGRPYYVAILDLNNDRRLNLIDEFYKACRGFHYQEVMQLSRALGMHPTTIYGWKYLITFPRYDIALAIIEWVKQGKPKEKVYHQAHEVSMLS
jgi:hypothetical protein